MGFIDEIGLKEHLSPTRANGLVSMIKILKCMLWHSTHNKIKNKNELLIVLPKLKLKLN
jgi:hypothetical protein